jgi:hypothetical protein
MTSNYFAFVFTGFLPARFPAKLVLRDVAALYRAADRWRSRLVRLDDGKYDAGSLADGHSLRINSYRTRSKALRACISDEFVRVLDGREVGSVVATERVY